MRTFWGNRIRSKNWRTTICLRTSSALDVSMVSLTLCFRMIYWNWTVPDCRCFLRLSALRSKLKYDAIGILPQNPCYKREAIISLIWLRHTYYIITAKEFKCKMTYNFPCIIEIITQRRNWSTSWRNWSGLDKFRMSSVIFCTILSNESFALKI